MNAKLTFSQVIILAITLQYGIISFEMPRYLAEEFGYNGWLSLFGFGALASINLWLIALVYRFGKGVSIYKIARRVLPSGVVVPLCSLLILLWTVLGVLISKQYLLILRSTSFPTINPLYLYILLGALVLLMLSKDIIGIATATVIFFVCVFWLLILVPATLSNHFNFARFTPYLFKDAGFTLRGMLNIYFAFLGYELCLLLFPYSGKKTRLMQGFQISNLIVTLVYCFIAFLTFSFYSFEQLKQLAYPSLNTLSFIRFPFVQRVDDFIFNLFLLRALIITTMYLWAALELVKNMVATAKNRLIPYVAVSLLAAIIAMWDRGDLQKTERLLHYIGITEIGVAFLLPALLLILIYIHHRKERPKHV
ncbi:GerAB/ArcD/ProY family transporter [Paenibacillus lignilyticus]|uniref:GerAB/ArcD/ProY family transporter n=1 Tax=Paenibacillus lignilyticus TaxID=1172615 RepID=A0ABS5C675_9BACL|nr:GerAB/ArcD/ProY family transporter [Paenibacillus lignilyticus]MBP3961499.1 GerAB/ArcD/ProY family transporter [Paenibacillus lignilyticus]